MKKQPKKLVLKKKTLRDLTAHDAGEVKGGWWAYQRGFLLSHPVLQEVPLAVRALPRR
jgi:hypothetical protein